MTSQSIVFLYNSPNTILVNKTQYMVYVCVILQDTEFPKDFGVNPYLGQAKAPSGHLARSGGFRLSNTFQAHSHPISGYVWAKLSL